MKRLWIISIVLVVALASMACGVSINLPVDKIVTGPTVTEDIEIERPTGDVAELTLDFGAGQLRLRPGAGNDFVNGTAVYNVKDFKPEIGISGSKVNIQTGHLDINGFPKIDNLDDFKNEWDLRLGDTPMKLKIRAGAYKGDMEFGGLALEKLEISDGASDVDLNFAQPNLVEMEKLEYSTGASNVELKGLANANFREMVFRGGAGDYLLDFSGALQQDAEVKLDSGVSQVTVIVPAGMSVRVVMELGLATIDTDGAWEKSGKDYLLAGEGPTLTIVVKLGAGSLDLISR